MTKTEITTDQIVGVLKGAKKALETGKWWQGNAEYEVDETEENECFDYHCAGTAIWTSMNSVPYRFGEGNEFKEAIEKEFVVGLPEVIERSYDTPALIRYRTITKWNDEPGRTLEEVLAHFDSTIARLSS